ncbi:CxC2 domain-containing protein [Mycena chlorophos]|uniref:CxC2 domain-containing protein n=1 Tax=Mycena chlorophos TaxID=658473 RepID=A0A8H6SMH9_MYCCL|nr:CxC2 domain-containing protein [Mycena chlorophos]
MITPLVSLRMRVVADGCRASGTPVPMKRRRRHSVSEIDTSAFSIEADGYILDLEDAEDAERPKEKPIRPSDAALERWAAMHRNAFLRELLRHDGRGEESSEFCTRCNIEGHAAKYRCDDCLCSRLLCAGCCIEVHGQLPFHNIQEWDAAALFFSKTSLQQLGLRVQLGHCESNAHCPRPTPAHDDFVVLHDNGIHVVTFDYCGCSNAEEGYLQLLRARFFPATTQRPQTCATFTCLDRFAAFSLKPKTNAMDFYDTLERMTDGAGDKPPDRYRMLLRMEREWRHLMLLKRGGQSGYKSNEAEETSTGELAIRCPACPRPGVNIPEDWPDADPQNEYLYSQFFAMDACFQLKRRMVSSEARDPALGPGFAFMVESKPYREYLRTATNNQEMSTCSGLKALAQANTKFSKGYAATGVGMVVCARHEFVQPTSVGDLQKGERYSNMDYIFAAMLRHIHRFLRKVVSYDIVCQWHKYIFKRLGQLPAFLKVVLLREWTKFVVPKLHILGHTLDCKNKYDLNLIPGSGQTDAEGIERAWASAGGLSGTYWSFWNWTKLLGLPATLRRRLDAAEIELRKQKEAFKEFSEQQAELVPVWREMVLKYEADKTQKNPYVAEMKGVITEAQVRLQLQNQEEEQARQGRTALRSGNNRVKAQAILKKSQTTAEQLELGSARRKLNRDVQTLRTLQATFTPEALSKLASLSLPDTAVAEDVPLLLPSALAVSWTASADPIQGLEPRLAELLSMERLHRCAQMGHSLAHLRNHLHIRKRLRVNKELHVRHQAANTRALAVRARNESQLLFFADIYQTAWFAVLQIEGGDESKVGFTRLRREDIRYMDEPEVLSKKAEKAKERKERQERLHARIQEEEGWFEGEGQEKGKEKDEMEVEDPNEDDDFFMKGSNQVDMVEAVRIEWSKAWARLRRWEEEVGILTEETRRMPVSHESWALMWEKRLTAVPVGTIPEAEAEAPEQLLEERENELEREEEEEDSDEKRS